jgi:hypothetical protein
MPALTAILGTTTARAPGAALDALLTDVYTTAPETP